MLVLTRKTGEAIQIGEQVTVEVLEMRGGRVRLGITAPNDVGVHRSEVIFKVAPGRPVAPIPSALQDRRVAVGS